MATRLPLFPLTTVLVPGLVLPLHVFEQRYRVLVRALMELPDGATRQFGVITRRPGAAAGPLVDPTAGPGGTPGPGDGEEPDPGPVEAGDPPPLYEVGCTAELREVTPYADGRFDIVTVGYSRFRLVGFDTEAGTPYHTGLVEFMGEPDGDEAELGDLAERVALRFAAYRDRLRVRQAGVPTDPRVLSYLVAAAAVLPLPERQALLEEPTTTDRLRTELALLRRETALIEAFGALPDADLPSTEVNPN